MGGGGVAGAGEKECLLSPVQAQRGVWLIKLVFANLSLRQCLLINIVHKRYKPRPTICNKILLQRTAQGRKLSNLKLKYLHENEKKTILAC